MFQKFAAAYLDPTTNAGTARWVALGVIAWDCLAKGVNVTNGAALLALGGVDLLARFLTAPPHPPAGVA